MGTQGDHTLGRTSHLLIEYWATFSGGRISTFWSSSPIASARPAPSPSQQAVIIAAPVLCVFRFIFKVFHKTESYSGDILYLVTSKPYSVCLGV